MKKIQFDKKYLKIALYVLFVICSAIVFEKILGNVGSIWQTLSYIIIILQKLLSPFIYGLFVAYILNTSVRSFEQKLPGKLIFFKTRPGSKRFRAVIFTCILLISIILWIIAYLIPEVSMSIQNLIKTLNNAENNLNIYYYNSNFFKALWTALNETFDLPCASKDVIDIILEPLTKSVTNIPNILNIVLYGTLNAANVLLYFIIGLMIAFYMFRDIEHFDALITKFLMTIFKKSTAEKVIYFTKPSNSMFLGVPVFTVLRNMLRAIINKRYDEKYVFLSGESMQQTGDEQN